MTNLRKPVKVALPEQPGEEPRGNPEAAHAKAKRARKDSRRVARNKGRR